VPEADIAGSIDRWPQDSLWRAVAAALSFGILLVRLALPGWEGITTGTLGYAIQYCAQGRRYLTRPEGSLFASRSPFTGLL
jgi:hypothetical protein